MSATRLESLLSNHELQPLLPVVYIAWADGKLKQSQATRIRELAGVLPAFGQAAQETLAAWLRPDQPPSATELARLRRCIHDHAQQRQHSLAGMAAAMQPDISTAVSDAVTAYEQEQELNPAGLSAALFSGGEPVRQDFDEPQPSFAPSELQAVLEGAYASEWQWVRETLADDVFTYADDETSEAQRARVLDWLRHLIAAGMGFYPMPEAVGGQANMPGFIHLFMALAMFDLSLVVKFGVQFGLFGGSIMMLGSEAQQQEYLADIAAGRHLGGFAMTESGHGSNVQALETTATYDSETEEFIIHTPTLSARKEWIGNAARDGRTVTVFAQLSTGGDDYGVHAFVVPIRNTDGTPAAGVRIEDCGHKMGLNGVDNGRLYFDQVRVPRENLLARYAQVAAGGSYDSPIASDDKRFFTMLGTLVSGRISVAGASVTAAKKALAIAIRYGALRRQFGGDGGEQKILDYISHQTRLFPALAHSYALHFAVADLIERFKHRTDDSTREVETLAAGLKAMASWHAIDAIQQARECCGGLGFLSANQIANLRRDIDVFATFEGDNIVLLNLLAKNRLAGYAKNFEQSLVVTVMQELSTYARTELIETNPVMARKTDEAHLRAAEFHLGLLELRAHNLLVTAARRMRKRIDQGMEPFAAFSQIQDHMLAYAQAEMDRHVAACFDDAIAGMDAGLARAALERLRQLAAIDSIYQSSAWYLYNGYYHPTKHRALRKLRLKLMAEIRPDALAYTAAFAIPDRCLTAPIAYEDYIGRNSP